jgi:hypothetical protein
MINQNLFYPNWSKNSDFEAIQYAEKLKGDMNQHIGGGDDHTFAAGRTHVSLEQNSENQ